MREELAHVKQQLKAARESQKHIHTDKLIMSKEYEEVRLTQVAHAKSSRVICVNLIEAGATEDVERLRRYISFEDFHCFFFRRHIMVGRN